MVDNESIKMNEFIANSSYLQSVNKDKATMLLLTLIFALTTAQLINAGPIEGERYVEVRDGDGVMRVIDLWEQPDLDLLDEVTRNPADNIYILYTRRNPRVGQTLVMNNPNSIRNSNFNSGLPTVVIAHGWLSDQETDINPYIRDAFLNRFDVNVIVLDWRRLAYSGYITAVNGVPAIGRGLGQFLQFLNANTGAPYNRMHLIGFSLGAHVVGSAGRFLRSVVARITGLDPAGPLWNYNSDRLSASDGVYVEAMHTDGGILGLGLGTRVGHADFYPNGGNSQPGCLTGICDHNRAWRLFTATVTHDHHIGTECTSNLQVTLNNCNGPNRLPMGNGQVTKFGSGMYRLSTGRSHPF